MNITTALIVALFTAIASLVGIVVGQMMAFSKDRSLERWRKERDRLLELEEAAGMVVELMGAYQPAEEQRALYAEKREYLAGSAGRFARYPQVRQTVRDLNNVLDRLFKSKLDHADDEQELKKESEASLRALLTACDTVVDQRSRSLRWLSRIFASDT
jgi:hypothetical protein